MSTFLGILKEYPNLSVDYFKDKALESNIGAYFLSHCHTDHMHGLKTPAFEKRLKVDSRQPAKLYLSKVSQTLLENDRKYSHLKPFMVALPVNEPITITLNPSTLPDKGKEVTVTLLQAGHCPGSVMFLFEGSNGRVLYTGDFRLSLSDLEASSFLKNDMGEKKKIANLYLDTTFCKPDAFYIPARDDSWTAALDIIKPWLAENPNHYVRIICSAQYGYERFFIGLNESLNCKVHVNDFKLRRYDGMPEVQNALTILPHESRIHACTWSKKTKDSDSDDDTEDVYGSYKLPCGHKSNNQMRILHIKLSAMWYARYVTVEEISCKTSSNFYRVCYSMHASLEELRNFVEYVQPDSITPNVVSKGVQPATLIKWLRNPLNVTTEPMGSESPPLLGNLVLSAQPNVENQGHVELSGSQTTVNSSPGKDNYESEIDLSGGDSGPIFIKTPEKNPHSPQWCFTSPGKTSRSSSRLTDCEMESPFKLSLKHSTERKLSMVEIVDNLSDAELKNSQQMTLSQSSISSISGDTETVTEKLGLAADGHKSADGCAVTSVDGSTGIAGDGNIESINGDQMEVDLAKVQSGNSSACKNDSIDSGNNQLKRVNHEDDNSTKRVKTSSNGLETKEHREGSPNTFSSDDSSVVECEDDQTEDSCSDSGSETPDDIPNAIPVRRGQVEVVDLSSSESRGNSSRGSSIDRTSEQGHLTDSDETPDRIITNTGVIYPVNDDVRKRLFPVDNSNVEVITLD